MSSLHNNDCEFQKARFGEILDGIRSLTSARPGSLKSITAELKPLLAEIRTMVGEEIESVLNSYAGEAVGDLEQKRSVAKSVNELLDGLGLRIKCPKTGLGSTLVGVPCGNNLGAGRFQLNAGGLHPSRTVYFAKFPQLDLILRDTQERRRSSNPSHQR